MDGIREGFIWQSGMWIPVYLSGVGWCTPCSHAATDGVDTYSSGTGGDEHASIGDGKVTCCSTVGRPCEWSGPWDSVELPLADED